MPTPTPLLVSLSPRPPRFFRFGPFELDVRAGELRKHGVRLRLRAQTTQILLMLLENAGEVVLREEIRQKLWPKDTTVDFDHGINAAVQKLRDVLGESADAPRYIETLPRRGYRFLGNVERVAEEPAPASPPPLQVIEDRPTARLWSRWIRISAVVATVCLVVGSVHWGWPREPRPLIRNWTLSLGAVRTPVVSPDGTAVVYSKDGKLLYRRLDSLTETVLRDRRTVTDTPAWSPDSSQIIFPTRAGWLVRMQVPNGAPTNVYEFNGPTRGVGFGPNGEILYAAFERGGYAPLYLIPAAGGTPVRIAVPGLKEGWFYSPEFLPDGQNFIFAWSAEKASEAGLFLATLINGKITRGPFRLRNNLTPGHFTPSGGGRLLYLQGDNLYAQGLNVRAGRLEGEPRHIVDGVDSNLAHRDASFSVSRNGVLAWESGKEPMSRFTWFDRHGKILGTAGPLCESPSVRLSADDKHLLAYCENLGNIIFEANRDVYLKVPEAIRPAIWMPDSLHILYPRLDGTGFRLVERPAAGGAARDVSSIPNFNTLQDISPDGRFVLYRSAMVVQSIRIDAPADKAKAFVTSTHAQFSPDGHWAAYVANYSDGTLDVCVRPFPYDGLSTQISSGGGIEPVWRGDGKEIIYRNGSMIYGVRLEMKGGEIHASAPESLFTVRVPRGLVGDCQPLAVTRDGSRIMFAQAVDDNVPQASFVMTAWEQGLK